MKMELKSRIRKEGDQMSITLTGEGGFKAYFKAHNTVELIKQTAKMLKIMNISMTNFNLTEEEEEIDRSDS